MSPAPAEMHAAAARAIDALDAALRELSLDIHAHPEENFQEEHAHAVLTAFLERQGFAVERGAYGLPTAFRAEAGTGEPVVSVLCEYDALPGIGHACGHNLIAIVGAGAGVAAKQALEAAGLPGTVRVLGTPAEEGGGGKIKMIEQGAFQDVGAALMTHPAPLDSVRPSVLAIHTLEVEFHGRNAHAAAAPWEGLNALDALVLAYNGVGLLRQQLRPDVRVHGVIRHAGEKPNIIPDRAAAEFYVRAADDVMLDEVMERVMACFRGAAEATGCTLEHRWQGPRYSDLATNNPLAAIYTQHIRALGVEPMDADGRRGPGMGSTDMGDVSHVVPSIHPMFSIPAREGNHTPAFTEAAATPEAHAAALRSAVALAQTALDYVADADLRAQATADFQVSHPGK